MLLWVSKGIGSLTREPLLESKKFLISPFSSESASDKDEMSNADCKRELSKPPVAHHMVQRMSARTDIPAIISGRTCATE